MASSAADRLREVLETPSYRAAMVRLAPLQLCAPIVERRFVRDALGGITRRAFRKADVPIEKFVPSFNDEFYDWLGLFESVLDGRSAYVIVELGAGYGRWIALAANLCHAVGRPLGLLIACEAEPTHFRWLLTHLRDNGVDPARHRMINAAVARQRGTAPFYVGAATEWYGQSIAQNVIDSGRWPRRGLTGWLDRLRGASKPMAEAKMVDTVGLADILTDDVPTVDLMLVDIQGSEFDVFEPAMHLVDAKVRRVHVAIHSTNTEAAAGRDLGKMVSDLFQRHGWTSLVRVEPGEIRGIYGHPARFNDGVQNWKNPRL